MIERMKYILLLIFAGIKWFVLGVYDYFILPIYNYLDPSITIDGQFNKRQNFMSTLFEVLIFCGVCYVVYLLGVIVGSEQWFKLNPDMINDFVSVKGSSIILGGLGLMLLVWLFDILTPGSWLRKIGDNEYTAAGVLIAFIIAMGMIMSR
jgi:hypothetical protein